MRTLCRCPEPVRSVVAAVDKRRVAVRSSCDAWPVKSQSTGAGEVSQQPVDERQKEGSEQVNEAETRGLGMVVFKVRRCRWHWRAEVGIVDTEETAARQAKECSVRQVDVALQSRREVSYEPPLVPPFLD